MNYVHQNEPWFPSLDAALLGCPFEIPKLVSERLSLIEVPYWSFDEDELLGQLVIATARANDAIAIFQELAELRFPIERIVHVAAYEWDDYASMAANNTSAFNFRPKVGKEHEISNHALGVAIDINPRLNPFWGRNGVMLPTNGVHDPSLPGTILPDSAVVRLFKERGWIWGAEWISVKDYQHFEKPL
jgi:peptidoglycan L-alanyl-D-glutamate endopeptidase CwlK